ncbi:M23 family metallopeptidase [Filibacter tadaridae]|uniref:Stage II sporulation protein Q n=1 Tax=Filibacter tadaridae TaxID=2483811 RepID=A0A3P5WLL3_9BACL|nr:M23 family metallopeptidase [Filibacter tadaridae]VDC19435.1 Stage II sporulation protein Q [Filibacter tadaridae]
MREEKPNSPSQKNKSAKTKSWLWPIVYSGIAIVFVGMIWGYNAFMKEDSPGMADVAGKDADKGVTVETNAAKESLQYPFTEALLDDAIILQEYYDVEADDEMRESALLVFNQVYMTNSGVSISVKDEPFEVVASLSGKVEAIISDAFKGNEIVLTHANGLKTIYRSVTGILVKEGDEVTQGQALASTTANEWNPAAGTHLHFEVQKDGIAVNPRSFLAF